MLEVCDTWAYPLANAIRCALSVNKTGVVAVYTGSTINIPGADISPQELTGHLIRLSFEPVTLPKHIAISLTPSDKTLQDIVKKIGLPLVSTENLDLKTPILAIAEGFVVHLIIATYKACEPLTHETVEEYAIRNGMDRDKTIFPKLPLVPERQFPYKIESIGRGKSRITFTSIQKKDVDAVLNTVYNLSKK